MITHPQMDKLSETFVQWDAALTEMEQNKQ